MESLGTILEVWFNGRSVDPLEALSSAAWLAELWFQWIVRGLVTRFPGTFDLRFNGRFI